MKHAATAGQNRVSSDCWGRESVIGWFMRDFDAPGAMRIARGGRAVLAALEVWSDHAFYRGFGAGCFGAGRTDADGSPSRSCGRRVRMSDFIPRTGDRHAPAPL